MSFTGPHVEVLRVPAAGYPFKLDRFERYHSTSAPRVPLPYVRERTSASDFWSWVNVSNAVSGHLVHDHARLSAKAYDKVWSKAKDTASNLVNLAEMGQSMAMLSNRTLQAAEIFRNIRQKNLAGAVLALRMRDDDGFERIRRRDRARKSGDLWLEVQFGWKPIALDIKKSMDILEREFDTARLRGVSESWRSNSKPFEGAVGQRDFRNAGSSNLKVAASGRVVPTNPNLLLANQLGLVNPALVAWDLVPFSFIVDWFIPVSKYVESYTNDYGCSLRDTSSSWGCKADVISDWVYHDPTYGLIVERQDTARTFSYHRSQSFPPRPGLFDRMRIPEPTIWHALTSASLLAQELSWFKYHPA